MTKKNDQLTTTDTFQVKSRKKVKFTQVENEIIDCIIFENAVDKLVYMSLERYDYNNGTAINPSIGTLAATCCAKSKNTIRDSLKRLEEMGLIEIEKGGRKPNGEYYNNTYILEEIPEHIIYNSITNPDAVDAKRERDNARKAAKRKKKEDKLVSLEGSSNFEPLAKEAVKVLKGSSNFESPSSNSESPGSNFEGNNNTSSNTSSKDSISSKYVSSNARIVQSSNPIGLFKELKGIQRLNAVMRQKLEVLIASFGDFGKSIVSKAITIAAEKDKVELYYIEGICKKWLEAGLTKPEEIEDYITSFYQKRQEEAAAPVKQQGKQTSNNRKRGYTKKPVREEATPGWLKEEQEKTAAMTKPITLDNSEATEEEERRLAEVLKQYQR
ncbi:helix-turn-helix domain-containing protein [Bacillus wiedmannii]|uniref:helix-turn-helix domain-containing protein n=1 Tax=Bacillus wiedmannii TaxID=1890302 RepID=UPI000BF0AD80|nr:helix-turn-helix domain-containing protein [Bacillus wiedmannii]PEM08486.1 replication protein [Bacillus wiedmannii]